MRIGMITGEYPPMQGGVGAYTEILARALIAQGHAVSVLTSTEIPSEPDGAPPIYGHVASWNSPSTLRRIAAWQRDTRPDAIVLQFQTAAYRMAGLVHLVPALVRGAPFVTTFHDLRHPYLFPKAGPLRDAAVRLLARTSDGAIVTNHEDAAALARLKHLALIPIGSNILSDPPSDAIVQSLRASGMFKPDESVIGYFGLVNQSKGLDTLLRAMRILLDRGVRVRLALIGAVVGSSDPSNIAYAQTIDALIEALALAPHIHRTGYRDGPDVATYLALADVVALPFADGASYRRGTLMAAIRLARPIVTTCAALSVPTFRDGENMLLVPPSDPSALADAIASALTDAALRDRLSAGARLLADTFRWETIASETARFLEQVIADRSRR